MGRKVATGGTDETKDPTEGQAVEGSKLEDGAKPGSKKVKLPPTQVTLTLPHELAWRLRVKCQMEGIPPGRLVAPWLEPHLESDRLPYDKYAAKLASKAVVQDPVSAA